MCADCGRYDVKGGFAQGVDDDFRLAKQSDGKEGGAHAAGCVATHVFVLPAAGFIGPGASAVSENRRSAGEADLSAVRMSAEVEVHAGLGGFRDDFRRVHEQNAGGVFRGFFDGFVQVAGFVEVDIVQAQEPNGVIAFLNGLGFIHEHSDAALFQARHHLQPVMIAENAADSIGGVNVGGEGVHEREGFVIVSEGAESIVAGEDAEIVLEGGEGGGQALSFIHHAFDVQVGQMEDAKILKGAGQMRNGDLMLHDGVTQGVAHGDGPDARELEECF